MNNAVLETTKFVVDTSKFVHINREAVKTIASRFQKEDWKIPSLDPRYHFLAKEKRTLQYFFILDSINFSFWQNGKRRSFVKKFGNEYIRGYNALALGLKHAFLKDRRMEQTEFLIRIRRKEFLEAIDAQGKLPMLKKRLHTLHQNALILKNVFEDSVEQLVKKANKDASILIELLVTHFPSFNDTAQLEGQEIKFYKRAQLFISDINLAFQDKECGEFKNIGELTCFADYRLPQILRHWNIVEYESSLATLVDGLKPIKRGSREEIEIRAATIWAVEYLKNDLKKLHIEITSRDLDLLLWQKAKEMKNAKPHHRVRTIFY